MMELGAEGVFVGSGIFRSGDPAKRRRHRQGHRQLAGRRSARSSCPKTSAKPWSASMRTRFRPSWPLAASGYFSLAPLFEGEQEK